MTTFYDMPESEYFATDAANYSTLKLMDNPQKARHRLDNPKDSDALDFGRQFHAYVLKGISPASPKNAIECPFDSYRTKEAREWKLAQENAGLTIITQTAIRELQEREHVFESMLQSILKHREANKPIKEQHTTEVSIVWEIDGIPCKARLDWLGSDCSYIHDLKTVDDISDFARDFLNYRYYQQAPWYADAAAEAKNGLQHGFKFTAIEKSPPYQCAVFEVDENTMDLGRTKNLIALKKYAQCKAAGVWPSPYFGVEPLSLPAWFFRQNGVEI